MELLEHPHLDPDPSIDQWIMIPLEFDDLDGKLLVVRDQDSIAALFKGLERNRLERNFRWGVLASNQIEPLWNGLEDSEKFFICLHDALSLARP